MTTGITNEGKFRLGPTLKMLDPQVPIFTQSIFTRQNRYRDTLSAMRCFFKSSTTSRISALKDRALDDALT